MNNNTGAVISCQDLWMVFGAQAKKIFEQLRVTIAASDVEQMTAALRDEGLIPAVRHVTFEVKPGELFVIMGLSGSGKSTVIRCVSRLLEPTSCKINIFGEDILAASKKKLNEIRRNKIGMVFQHFGLFPHMTVAQNVAFPLKVQGVSEEERLKLADDVIKRVGLDGRQKAYPRELSGGQRQRVGIARSLAVNPEIWLLDEPFSALDPLIRRQLQDEFLTLQAELKKSIVFITHDFGEALRLADRIAIMRDGVMVQVGTPAEIVLNPADGYIAEFSKDIPKTRLMQVASIMEPLSAEQSGQEAADKENALSASMNIEEALCELMRQDEFARIPVQDGEGRLIGTLNQNKLVKALGGAIQ